MNELNFSGENNRYPPALARPWAKQEAGGKDVGAVPLVTQYLRILLRWRWLILGSIALAFVVGLILTLLATPNYTASSRIEINREGSRIVDVSDVENKGGASSVDMEFYQTQYGLLS